MAGAWPGGDGAPGAPRHRAGRAPARHGGGPSRGSGAADARVRRHGRGWGYPPGSACGLPRRRASRPRATGRPGRRVSLPERAPTGAGHPRRQRHRPRLPGGGRTLGHHPAIGGTSAAVCSGSLARIGGVPGVRGRVARQAIVPLPSGRRHLRDRHAWGPPRGGRTPGVARQPGVAGTDGGAPARQRWGRGGRAGAAVRGDERCLCGLPLLAVRATRPPGRRRGRARTGRRPAGGVRCRARFARARSRSHDQRGAAPAHAGA